MGATLAVRPPSTEEESPALFVERRIRRFAGTTDWRQPLATKKDPRVKARKKLAQAEKDTGGIAEALSGL